MGPKIKTTVAPPPPPPVPPPTIDEAASDAAKRDVLSKRKSRSATFVSTAAGRAEGGTGTKMLLGQGG